MSKLTTFPRPVRSVPDPLALYLRPGHSDHNALSACMASGKRSFCGAVFDATKVKRHGELKDQILDAKLDAILDPRTMRSSMVGTYNEKLGLLPWGKKRIHEIGDFTGTSGEKIAGSIASFAVDNGFTQVMAATHLISGPEDPWLSADLDMLNRLCNSMAKSSAADTPIIYPLAVPYSVIRNKEKRQQLIEKLSESSMDSIWLMVEGQGRNSTAQAAINYIEAARDFHSLGIPIVADHVGGMFALSLLAFGAVGGISHGLMQHETFSTSHWKRVQKKSGSFGQKRQIYVPSIDAMLSEKEAEFLLNSRRAKSHFSCSNSACCPRGGKDMIQNHMRHYLYQRMEEVSGLSLMPETLRPQRFLENHLRPATDKALAAAQLDWDSKDVVKKMEKNRKHLDTLRIALGDFSRKKPPQSFAMHPEMRRSRVV